MSFRSISIAAVLLVVMAAPSSAAFMPDRDATPAERACCHKMAGKCGAMDSEPQSCCQKVRLAPESAALQAMNSSSSGGETAYGASPASDFRLLGLAPRFSATIFVRLSQDSPPSFTAPPILRI